MKVSVFLWILALGGALANGIVGFFLSQNPRANSELHLIIGFATAAFILLGLFMILAQSKQAIERRVAASTGDLKILSHKRETSLLPSFLSFGLCTLGLITGTLSDGGTFPLVHGAIGISTAAATALALFRWRSLAKSLDSTPAFPSN